MKNKFTLLLLIWVSICSKIFSQDFAFQAKAGYQEYIFLNSVYKNTHDQWQGFGTSLEIMYKENFFLSLGYSRIKANVTDKEIFYRDYTRIKTFGLGIGYQHSFSDKFKIRPSINIGKPKWENVKGTNLNLDLGFQYYIFKKLSIFFDTGIKFLHFDIKAPLDIADNYRNATLLHFQLGLSFRE